MIYDRVENLKKYTVINDGIDQVVKFLQENDVFKIAKGKYVISDNVNFTCHEYIGKEELDDEYESHEKYIDVQMVFENEELCNISFDKPNVTQENEKDFYVTNAKKKDVLVLNSEVFVIFLPGELHKPALKINDKLVRKLVFKVKA